MGQNIFTEYQPYFFVGIGICLMLASAFIKSKRALLKQTGLPADGIIYEQEFQNSFELFSGSSSQSNKKTTVRFVTQDEQWITGVIDQDFTISYNGQYKDGDPVKVYYDRNNPLRFYVETGQSEFAGRLLCAAIDLLFTGIGLWKLFF